MYDPELERIDMIEPENQYVDRVIRDILAGIQSADEAELGRLQRELERAASDGSLTVQQLNDLRAQEPTPEQIRDLLRTRKIPPR
jgi:hypothetical protein